MFHMDMLTLVLTVSQVLYKGFSQINSFSSHTLHEIRTTAIIHILQMRKLNLRHLRRLLRI